VARRERQPGVEDACRLTATLDLDQPDVAATRRTAARRSSSGLGLGKRGLWRRPPYGGGSRSLDAGDSLVPVLTVGLDAGALGSVVDVAPAVLAHFGVQAPPYVLRRAA
jgi:hypothetical protein